MKEVSSNDIKQLTHENIQADLNILENEILPLLNHSQKHRLFMAEVKYPIEDKDFSEDEPNLRSAFIVTKRLKDNIVALATEVVIESLIKKQQGEQSEA